MGKGNYAPPRMARENGYEMVYIDYLHEYGDTVSPDESRSEWNSLLAHLRIAMEVESYETVDRFEGDLSIIGERWMEDEGSRFCVGIIDYEGLYAAVVFFIDIDDDHEGETPDEWLAALKKDAETVFHTLNVDGYELRVRTGPWTSGAYTDPVATEETEPSDFTIEIYRDHPGEDGRYRIGTLRPPPCLLSDTRSEAEAFWKRVLSAARQDYKDSREQSDIDEDHDFIMYLIDYGWTQVDEPEFEFNILHL